MFTSEADVLRGRRVDAEPGFIPHLQKTTHENGTSAAHVFSSMEPKN